MQVGPVVVYPLGLALGVAFLTAGAVGSPFARRAGFAPALWWRVLTVGMALCVAGARLAYIATDWAYYATHPLEIVRPPLSGLSYTGGLAAGLLYVAAVARRRSEPFGHVADLFALPLISGLIVVAVMWSAPIPLAGAPDWAVAMGEFVYVSGLYVLLWWTAAKRRYRSFPGQLFFGALAGDELLRLLCGSWTSAFGPQGWMGSADLHFLHAGAAVGALGLYVVLSRRGRRTLQFTSASAARRPLSRWIGWLTAYGFLVLLLVVARATRGL